jgi:hypothetical protein
VQSRAFVRGEGTQSRHKGCLSAPSLEQKPRSFILHVTIHGLQETALALCATHQHKCWPILLTWAQRPILSQKHHDEVGTRHATRLAYHPTSLELFSPPLAVVRGGVVPGRASHVTHPSPLGVLSHQAGVQVVAATASRSCIPPRMHSVLDITCAEHLSMSAGQECLNIVWVRRHLILRFFQQNSCL